MGLRIFGACVAVLLAAFAVARYRKGQLRRGELLFVALVTGGLAIAAVAPGLFDPLLSVLGFQAGNAERIIGLLVISNLFTLALVFRGFSRADQLSNEIGDLVDRLALNRLGDQGLHLAPACCAVVIPAFNEEDNLPLVLADLPKSVAGLATQAIVVADGCTDATEEVARDMGAIVIRRDLRRGSGAAVRLGYEVAQGSGAKVVVTLDGDGQHDPAEIESLVTPIAEGRADVVQGSRVLGSFEADSRVRRYGVTLFARIMSLMGRKKITDPSTGFRAIATAALVRLDLRQDQFYVSELVLDALRKGLRIEEVPIRMRARATGATKKPPSLRYAWGFSKALVRTWLR